MTTAPETPPRWIDYIPLDSLVPAERNPKDHHPDIGKSLERFGYVEAITMDERSGRIVAGHGRREHLIALRESGQPAPGGVVLDPFGGSGSTLIAAHNLGRVARLVELSPGYCDVILDRWERHSGEPPVLVERA